MKSLFSFTNTILLLLSVLFICTLATTTKAATEKCDCSDFDSCREIGFESLENEDFEAAYSCLKVAEKKNFGIYSPQITAGLCISAIALEKYKEAATSLTSIIFFEQRHGGVSPYLNALRANVYLEQDLFDKALEDINNAIKSEPKSGGFLAQRARINFYYNRKKTELLKNIGSEEPDGILVDIDEDIQKAIEVNPYNNEMFIDLSNLELLRGRIEKALDYANKAIEIDKSVSTAHSNKCIALSRLCMIEEAYEECKKAVSIKPKYYLYHMNLGDLLGYQNDIDAQIEEYEEAMDLQPNKTGFSLASLSKSYIRNDDVTEAKDTINELFDNYSHTFKKKSIYNLVEIDALRLYRDTLNTDDSFPDMDELVSNGEEALSNGDFAEAAKYLTAAMFLDGNNADIILNLAKAYDGLDDSANASRYYRLSVCLTPEDEDTEEIQTIIDERFK